LGCCRHKIRLRDTAITGVRAPGYHEELVHIPVRCYQVRLERKTRRQGWTATSFEEWHRVLRAIQLVHPEQWVGGRGGTPGPRCGVATGTGIGIKSRSQADLLGTGYGMGGLKLCLTELGCSRLIWSQADNELSRARRPPTRAGVNRQERLLSAPRPLACVPRTTARVLKQSRTRAKVTPIRFAPLLAFRRVLCLCCPEDISPPSVAAKTQAAVHQIH